MRDFRRELAQHENDPQLPAPPKSEILRSTRGAALLEYAILLAAIACALLAGFYLTSGPEIPAYRQLSASLAAQQGTRSIDLENRTGDAGAATEAGTPEAVQPARAGRPLFWPAAVLLSAVILAGIAWTVAKLRRRRSQQHTPEKEAAPERDEDRIRVKRQVLWRSILDDPRLLLKNRAEVGHLMTRDVTVVSRRTTGEEIRRLMDEKRMHHVLVTDSNGQLLGVVSDRDLNAAATKTVGEIMTPDPITVDRNTTAGAAIATMLERHISCLPVLEDNQICGILTRTDLLLSLQCMLQWWLRFAQNLARTVDCSDKIDAVQAASGRYLIEQRTRLHALSQFAIAEEYARNDEWKTFEDEAKAFLDTAGELIAMQTFEGDRLTEMANNLLEITRS